MKIFEKLIRIYFKNRLQTLAVKAAFSSKVNREFLIFDRWATKVIHGYSWRKFSLAKPVLVYSLNYFETLLNRD